MVHRLIHWAVHNRLVVVLITLAMAAVGLYSAVMVNVEAYPDPAPAIVEVIAQYPGASAEEVERKVTIPLEVALAGMPGLQYTRSKSLFGLSHLRNQFEYGEDFFHARLEVLNRLQSVDLPPGVVPQIAPTSPTGEIYRYVLRSPQDSDGKDIYTLRDLKSLNDWKLDKEFRRVPRIADMVSFGGAVKRYEIQPDPERLKRYGISLDQLGNAVARSNANVGGDYVQQGDTVQAIRGLGLIGDGQDPTQYLTADTAPSEAAAQLRAEEERRLKEIRQIVLASTNNVPVQVGDVVDGGPRPSGSAVEQKGVVVGEQTRKGRVAVSLPKLDKSGEEELDEHGERKWEELEDVVEGVVLLRKGEQSIPALADVEKKVQQLNDGRLLPGVKLETIYDRKQLINVTTSTVRENVLLGIGLVTFILLLFLNHTRSALIVAINIPLALLFAFSVLYLRGKSANLLSLGAVDFGIIVDSSVIMVESIYRYVSSGERSDLNLKNRILKASGEVERSLFFSTIIMVFALLPLFTMQGPEGQIFGPMADTYAFALGGALILSLTLSPVLCGLLFRNVKPAKDNFLVRRIKTFYLRQLDFVLRRRWATVGLFAALLTLTLVAMPFLGREFMPELEEGNVYIRGTFPVNVSLDEVGRQARLARRQIMTHPEVKAIMCQMGRPDDGTDPTGFYNAEFFVPLKAEEEWPQTKTSDGWFQSLFGATRPHAKDELIAELEDELKRAVVGVDWNFSQNIRDNVMETLSGVKGENSIKIFGPDLDKLEQFANDVRNKLITVPGIANIGIFTIKGQANLEFAIDRQRCALWNISVAQVQEALQTAVAGKAFTQMVEGERTFDITVRWPEALRRNVDEILNIPVDVTNNRVIGDGPGASNGGAGDFAERGSSQPLPAFTGNSFNNTFTDPASVPRRRLRDLVVPMNEAGQPDPNGKFVRSGASTISREQGERQIAIKFSVRGRDLASAVADAQKRTNDMLKPPYRIEWSGEFQEMQEAVDRLLIVVSLSLVLIVILLYLALQSLMDAMTVLSNVVVMSIGGFWALLITGTNFNISAGVGFISILGVGIMNGLLMVSRFNQQRSHGIPVQDAVRDGVEKLIRPLTMTALAAIFGLLPAALSTKIGSQTQRPLAIVVVGGMLMTLAMANLVPVIYSFYGAREPRETGGIGH